MFKMGSVTLFGRQPSATRHRRARVSAMPDRRRSPHPDATHPVGSGEGRRVAFARNLKGYKCAALRKHRKLHEVALRLAGFDRFAFDGRVTTVWSRSDRRRCFAACRTGSLDGERDRAASPSVSDEGVTCGRDPHHVSRIIHRGEPPVDQTARPWFTR